ncbi:MAG: glycosyltransferase [Bacteroidetes bacterium]|nr:glycosyltransferase [Bacteroidota bacterium]
MRHPRISLCMIVKNEEGTLANCLRSVSGVADEIIVVDTGSSDSTSEVAGTFGAKVVSHEWHEDFSDARNVSLDHATGDWILVLDADEELPESTGRRIPETVEAAQADGLELTVRSELPAGDAASYDDSRIVRLFRNRKEYRYIMPIHEQIRPSIEKNGGKIFSSDLVIIHHGYASMVVQGKENRADRNLKMLHEAILKSPAEPYFHYQLGSVLMSTGKRSEALVELKSVLDLDYRKMGGAILDKLYMKISQLALEKNDFVSAIQNADSSLRINPENSISMYVAAVGYLSMNRIADGYEYLLRIRAIGGGSLRIGRQLEELIDACEKVLKA